MESMVLCRDIKVVAEVTNGLERMSAETVIVSADTTRTVIDDPIAMVLGLGIRASRQGVQAKTA